MSFDPLLHLPFSIFRLRLLLRPKRAARIPPHHAALFYAMLCDANACRTGEEPAMPDGVLLDAPDQAIIYATPDHPISMGMTILVPSDTNPQPKLNGIIDGLRSLGRNPRHNQALRELTIDRIEDLNSGKTIQAAGQAAAVSAETLQRQFNHLKDCSILSLCWTMPLRCSRPKPKRLDGHSFLDLAIGKAVSDESNIPRDANNPSHAPIHARIIANDLVWLDVGYGGQDRKTQDRKTLGGVVGKLTIDAAAGLEPADRAILVLGQYVRLGENTRFGFGAYHIEQCSENAPRCPRTDSMLERAFKNEAIDRVSTELQLDSGVLAQSISAIRQRSYRPDPCSHVVIAKSSGGTRTLSIPSTRDRAIARLVLNIITASLDAFMESSSMAYRRGLGRDQAARRLRQHFRDGYRWAIKADFLNFFDNVDHLLLRRHLKAYLADSISSDSGSQDPTNGRSKFLTAHAP